MFRVAFFVTRYVSQGFSVVGYQTILAVSGREESVDMSIHAGRAHAEKEREPFLIRFDEERHAAALVSALEGIPPAEVRRRAGRWEVLFVGGKTDSTVVRVLDAIRSTLAGDEGASAQILLDGHKYLMQAE
jgi:hypothetical protein